MVKVGLNQPDTLLSKEQLREVERFQARFAGIERQLHDCVDEFLSVLNRHYFNRENGYIDEQAANLREIVTIQSKLELLAASMSAGAGELKTRMLELQRELQSQAGGATHGPKRAPLPEPGPEAGARNDGQAEAKSEPVPGPEVTSKGEPAQKYRLMGGDGEKLCDGSEAGGEISLKLVFEDMRLADPSNTEALNQVSSALRKLLYERKLIGYSKTSLVFGKNRTVDEVLADLEPIFFSDAIKQLLISRGLIGPGEVGRLRLACNVRRELVYVSKQ